MVFFMMNIVMEIVMSMMFFFMNNWNKLLLGVMKWFMNLNGVMLFDFNRSWMDFGNFDRVWNFFVDWNMNGLLYRHRNVMWYFHFICSIENDLVIGNIS